MDKSGLLFTLMAAVLWGTTGTAQALAPQGAGSFSIGALRLLVGGLALLAFAHFRHRMVPAAALRRSFGALFLAGVCMAAYQVLFFAGVAQTGVAVGTIVGIGSSPVLAGALAYGVRKEKPGWRWALATGLAVTGCALLVVFGSQIHVNPTGLLLAVGAGAAYATFTLLTKRLLELQALEGTMAVIFCLGALVLSPLLLTQPLGWVITWRGAAVVLHLGLFATASAYILFGYGLRLLPVATAVTLSLAEPMTAGLLGVLLLREKLAAHTVFGIALILSGLLVLSLQNISPRLWWNRRRGTQASTGEVRTVTDGYRVHDSNRAGIFGFFCLFMKVDLRRPTAPVRLTDSIPNGIISLWITVPGF